MAASDDTRDDLRATLAARQELGPDFEAEIVESFLERLDRTIEDRVDARVDARLAGNKAAPAEKKGTPAELVFASMLGGVLASVAIGMTTEAEGGPAILLVWIVIAVINVAHAVAGRSRS